MIAYLILLHNSPRQLARLVGALDGPDVRFFVHVDRKVGIGQFRYMVRQFPNVKFVRPRQAIEWGGWSMVEAELILMRAALRAGAQHMTLLSGMDFPIWCNRRLITHFTNNRRSYMEFHRIPSAFWDRGARNRVDQYWLCDDPIRIRSELWRRTAGRIWRPIWHRVIRRFSNLFLKLGYELGIRRRRPAGLEHYVGSQWWSLSQEAAQYVLDFVKREPRIVRFYRHSHVPDEGFIQTVLMNSPLRDSIVNNNLRYIEWDGSFNPRVLDINDLDSILQSGAAFARKITLNAAKDISGRMVSSEALIRALEDRRALEEVEPQPATPKPTPATLA